MTSEVDSRKPQASLRLVFVSTVICFLLYGGWIAFHQLDEIAQALIRIGGWGIGVALTLSLVNYGLRLVRWEWFTRRLGYRVPLAFNAHVYLAGFTLTATPGKAGEMIRSFFLKRYGVFYNDSIALFLAERITDLLAVALLASLILLQFTYGTTVFVITAVLLVLVGVAVHARRVRQWVVEKLFSHPKRKLDRMVRHIVEMLASTDRLLDARGYGGALVLGLVAWSAEALAFWFLGQRLGYELSLPVMMSIYAFAMVAGAVSFMPGGIGGAEAAMFLLLKSLGVSAPDAVSLTLVSRISTLWFAVLLGLPSFLYLGKHDDSHGSQ